jgi:hypothetical protein
MCLIYAHDVTYILSSNCAVLNTCMAFKKTLTLEFGLKRCILLTITEIENILLILKVDQFVPVLMMYLKLQLCLNLIEILYFKSTNVCQLHC